MNRIMHPNYRRERASAFAAVIMMEIRDVVPNADLDAIHDRLFHVLFKNGAAWTTDEERAAIGFEPRDAEGWTPSDRIADGQRRAELLRSLLAISRVSE